MPGQEHRTGPRIVAGVDGSPSSISALRWAVRQAGLTGAAVEALLGSVSQHCVHHAHCPVVVMRAQEHDRQDPQA